MMSRGEYLGLLDLKLGFGPDSRHMFARKVACSNRTALSRAVGEDGCVRLLREQNVVYSRKMALEFAARICTRKVIGNEC